MKRLLILSIAITLSIGGSLLFMSKTTNDITFTKIPEITNSEPISEITPIAEIPKETTQSIIEQPTISEPVVTKTIEPLLTNQEYINKYFGLSGVSYRQDVMIASIKIVVDEYPDRFTDDLRSNSFLYMNDYFNSPENINNPPLARIKFTWK